MRRYLLFLVVSLVLFSCKKEKEVIYPAPPLPPPTTPSTSVLLQDVVVERLPSPYYHFGYDTAGRISFVSFASGLNMYDIIYNGDKISEMRNNTLVNKDRLQYEYDTEGRVSAINYANSTGMVYTKVHFAYAGQKLIKLERERKLGSGFTVDKTLAMSYYTDGNLMEITYHHPATQFSGQIEFNWVVRFEQYDDKINTDGFDLLHSDFFDHLVLLPGVQLQKNNPRIEIRSGDGDDYTVDYAYTYNDRHAPLTKTGEFIYTSGPNAGQRFQTRSLFTYY
ncbi:MAG TPA: hypothetical protein VFH08_17725 [Chitinophagaceae bacterium]|nr:hypothetical protein [Chitinophagaceae bacterium]